MVDDINFPKGLPPVSATNRVGKVKRKLRDEDRPPFKQILEPEDQKDKEKKKEKKDGKRDPAGKKNKGSKNNSSLQADSKSTDEAEAGSKKKIIDVRV